MFGFVNCWYKYIKVPKKRFFRTTMCSSKDMSSLIQLDWSKNYGTQKVMKMIMENIFMKNAFKDSIHGSVFSDYIFYVIHLCRSLYFHVSS